ncbi:L,D-transpeptidase [Lyngbya confervoides]|uniref:L,D-transpeptidase n=1 Tax=Lyngbya confervoides BDU141951 TaxID=1574623 RepID=A0ABD4SZ23_9CYAN|nr:L,D-transpeptidase [Lyngbya confervoides]MCM1981390.1 L,D-transpeptidase [Lyngbya confervoides BDU141951]
MSRVNVKLLGVCAALALCGAPLAVHAEPILSLGLPGLPQPESYLPGPPLANRIELSLSQRRVTLYQDDQRLGQYPVGVGRPGWETPVGQFAVKTKIVNPSWKHPFEGYVIPSGDPQNPLGNRWIGFWTDGDNWVGFHGTSSSMRASVGTAASHGCVRMLDEHIEKMFELVSVGTPVIVTP